MGYRTVKVADNAPGIELDEDVEAHAFYLSRT